MTQPQLVTMPQLLQAWHGHTTVSLEEACSAVSLGLVSALSSNDEYAAILIDECNNLHVVLIREDYSGLSVPIWVNGTKVSHN